MIKTGKISIEETWALTSLGPDETTPEQLAAMIRNHWHIENRLHYVRDFTYARTAAGLTCGTCRAIWRA